MPSAWMIASPFLGGAWAWLVFALVGESVSSWTLVVAGCFVVGVFCGLAS